MNQNIKDKDLTLENIPQGLIDELTSRFKNVIFELDVTSGPELTTIKSKYITESNEIEKGIVVDPNTYEPLIAEGYLDYQYLIRYVETGDGITVKRVWPAPFFRKPKILGKYDPQDSTHL